METKPTPSTIAGIYARQHPIVASIAGILGVLAVAVVSFWNVYSTPVVYKTYPDMNIVKVLAADGTLMPKVEPKGQYKTVWTDEESVN